MTLRSSVSSLWCFGQAALQLLVGGVQLEAFIELVKDTLAIPGKGKGTAFGALDVGSACFMAFVSCLCCHLLPHMLPLAVAHMLLCERWPL